MRDEGEAEEAGARVERLRHEPQGLPVPCADARAPPEVLLDVLGGLLERDRLRLVGILQPRAAIRTGTTKSSVIVVSRSGWKSRRRTAYIPPFAPSTQPCLPSWYLRTVSYFQ